MGFMDAFDVDERKLELIDKALAKNPRKNDKRICICGHPMSRHDAENDMSCRPARFDCACVRAIPVLEVPDNRYFLARNEGSGEKHALMRGIFMARKGMEERFEEEAQWLVEMKCMNPACGKDTKIFPVRCDVDFYRIYDSNRDQGVTLFYCEECREVYYDSDEAIAAKRAMMIKRNTNQ
jgi:hypothetical protein